jgi:hypothetical protein
MSHPDLDQLLNALPYKQGWFGKMTYAELFGATRKREFFTCETSGLTNQLCNAGIAHQLAIVFA